MRGRPIVPHCATPACRERLSDYSYWRHRPVGEPLSPFDSALLIARGQTEPPATERPGVPTIVDGAEPRERRYHGRTVSLRLVECPDCGHRWYSSAS